MAGPDTTAQVHPAQLTRALLAAAAELAGTRVEQGTVEGLDIADGAVTGELLWAQITAGGKALARC